MYHGNQKLHGDVNVFESDPKKRKRFDHTSHKQSPDWPKLEHKYKRLLFITVLSIMAGAAFFLLAFGNTPMTGSQQGSEDVILWATAGAGIPFILFVPFLCVSYKNGVHAYSSEATCRYDDRLEFQEKQAVYKYRSYRGGTSSGVYEHTIRYDLIEKVVCNNRKHLLTIAAGGTDTEYRHNGSVERRVNFLAGHGYVNPYAREITIPLVYPDNELLIATLEKYSPVPIQYTNFEEE